MTIPINSFVSTGIVALHDVSPYWESEIDSAMELLIEKHCLTPALFVVPDFHNRHPLCESVEFSSKLKNWQDAGCELMLHGYSHLDDAPNMPMSLSRRLRALLLTNGEGEFLNLTCAQIRNRIITGRHNLKRLGITPTGFVPPAWLYNRHLPMVLSELGFQFYEGHMYIHRLPGSIRQFMPAVSFCARDAFRARLSAFHANATSQVIRIGGLFNFRLALHPVDFRNDKLVKAISELLYKSRERVNWQSYEKVLGLRTSDSMSQATPQNKRTG